MQDKELAELFNQIQDVEPDSGFRSRLWARIGEEEASRMWWRWPRLIPLAAGVAMAWLIGFSVVTWVMTPQQWSAAPQKRRDKVMMQLRPPASLSATTRATQLLTIPVGENSLVQVYMKGVRLQSSKMLLEGPFPMVSSLNFEV